MNIYYVTFSAIPARTASSIHIMKICQAFSENGHDVTLITPDRENDILKDIGSDDINKFYNVKGDFSFLRIRALMKKGWKLLYPFYVTKFLSGKKGIVFTRHIEIAAITTLFNKPTILEFHHTSYKGNAIQNILYKKLFKSLSLLKIVVISEALKNAFIKEGFKSDGIIVAHDGSDPVTSNKKMEFANKNMFKLEAGYVGQLYSGKGIEIIIDVAAMVPHVRFHIVGGQENDIAAWQGKAETKHLNNVVFHGFIPQTFISEYINAFDVCLLPNQRTISFFGNSTINISDFTSPLKMFDYMAHGKTIMASDLPVLREVLNESNAILCDPEDLDSWANELNKLADDTALREKLGTNALADFAARYTWRKRAEYIINNSKAGEVLNEH